MTKIHNNLPFTVASTPMAGTFYITPSKRQKSPPKLRHNTDKYLLHTVIISQSSVTPALPSILPPNPIKTVSFKPT